jgi:hypothetical protein
MILIDSFAQYIKYIIKHYAKLLKTNSSEPILKIDRFIRSDSGELYVIIHQLNNGQPIISKLSKVFDNNILISAFSSADIKLMRDAEKKSCFKLVGQDFSGLKQQATLHMLNTEKSTTKYYVVDEITQTMLDNLSGNDVYTIGFIKGMEYANRKG